jgi:hypothetical protein
MKHLIIGLLTIISSNSYSQIKIDSGQVYNSVSKIINNTLTNAMGQSIEVINEFSFSTKTNVTFISPNRVILDATITSIKGFIKGAGQDFSFDSDKKEMNGPVAKMFLPMLNKKNSKVYDNSGKYIDSTLTETSPEITNAFKQIGVNNNDPIIFKKSFINKTFEATKSWTDTTISTGKITTKAITKYQIDKIENDTVYVSYSSDESFEGTVEQQGIEMEMNGTKATTGNYKITLSSKLIQENTYTSKMESTVIYMGNEIPIKSTIVGIVSINRIL